MRTVPQPALVGALGLLERAVGYTRVGLTGVPGTALGRPTPCRGWDLRALLGHMIDSLAALREAAERGSVSLAVPAAPHSDDTAALLGRLRDEACGLLGSWTHEDGAELVRVAGSPVTAAVVASAGSLEIAVHGWDVAAACGLDHPLPVALAEELLELVDLLVTPGDRPGRFGAQLPVPAAAPADVRLLAALGRATVPPSG